MNEELTQVNQTQVNNQQQDNNQENLTQEEIENAVNSLSMEEIDMLLDDVLKEME